MSTCTRRPHARWTLCRCEECAPEQARVRKHLRAGILPPVRSEEAWAVVDRLMATGWTATAIASAAGIPVRSVRAAVEARTARGGAPSTWSYTRAEAIIAVEANGRRPGAGMIPVLGARRRLQALSALGWSMEAVHDWMGDNGLQAVGVSTMHAIRRHNLGQIRPGPDAAVRIAYELMSMMLPPASHKGTTFAQRHARKQGWVPPLAWDDIDDPAAVPDGLRTRAALNIEAQARRREVRALVDEGLTTARIARLLEISEDMVTRDLREMRESG